MEDFVSIIMPVYQAAEWLEDSVNSILGQNYANYELLLIENGSTDDSEMICDRFAERYSKIYSFHQKEKGVSKARNTGLRHAKGDYILFIDCDDLLDKNTLEIIVKEMQNTKADVLVFSFCRCYPSGNIDNAMVDLKEGLYNKEDIIGAFIKLFDANIAHNIGTKLYRRKLIADIRFNENADILEDIEFCMKAIQNADSLCFLNRNLYHYELKNPNSLVCGFKQNYYEIFMRFFQELYQWGKGTQGFDNWFYIKFMQGIWGVIKNAKREKSSFRSEFEKISSDEIVKFAKVNLKKIKFKGVTWKERIQFYMIWYKCYWGIMLLKN